MASRSYHARALVLKKTKLKETDLIVTLLRDTGQPLRVVAKGARKPTSSFSSRLEPGSIIDGLFASGRGDLDIIQEAKLVQSHEMLRDDIVTVTALTPSLELLARAGQNNITVERVYPLTVTYLSELEKTVTECSVYTEMQSSFQDGQSTQRVLALSMAHLLKASAFFGYRPSFDMCVTCGTPIDLHDGARFRVISVSEGGVACHVCERSLIGAMRMPSSIVGWMNFLLKSPFADIGLQMPDISTSLEICRFMQSWVQVHGGVKLKSLDFLLNSHLFDSNHEVCE